MRIFRPQSLLKIRKTRARRSNKKTAASKLFGIASEPTIPFVPLVMICFILVVFIKSPFLGLLALLCYGLWFMYEQHHKSQLIRALNIADVDGMTGHDFERYVAQLLTYQGYRATVTPGSGDNGVDIIAHSNGVGWAVQCKRQSSNVARNAISDAVAATNSTLFKCTRAMVVTNNYFSKAAIQYAQSTNCILIDRDALSRWIFEAQNQ